MDRVSSLLSRVLHKRGIEAHAQSALIVHRAQQWLHERSPALRTGAKATRVKDGALIVTCMHSIALQECNDSATDLIAYLKENCPSGAVSVVQATRG